MAMTEKQLESALVSMTGTLIYLRDMRNTLNSKPVIPVAVAPLMPDTAYKVQELETAFEAAELAARVEAQPLLDEWLMRRGLVTGGILRATTFSRYAGSGGAKSEVTGGIVSARLHAYLDSGVRVVAVYLADASIAVPGGYTYSGLEAMPQRFRYQSECNFNAFGEATVKDANGSEIKALRVSVPIQAKQRTEWARRGNLELV